MARPTRSIANIPERKRPERVDANSGHIYFERRRPRPGRVDALALIHNQVMATQRPGAGEILLCLEHTAIGLDAMERHAPRPRTSQPRRSDRRVFVKSDFSSPTHADGLYESYHRFQGPDPARIAAQAGCAYRKSSPSILVMQSTQDRTTQNAPRRRLGGT
jgi:hypothetical protein